MKLLERPWIFDLGADFYAWFNNNPLWRASCAHLADFFPQARGRALTVLDLGCGPGVTAIALAEARPDARLIGADLATRMIAVAQRETRQRRLEGRISYVICDARALPFAAGAFPVVAAHSFLYLVPDRPRVLQEAARVLEDQGKYVSMEPRAGKNGLFWLRRHRADVRFIIAIALWRLYSGFHARFDAAGFRELLAQAGFVSTGVQVVLDGVGIIGYGEKR